MHGHIGTALKKNRRVLYVGFVFFFGIVAIASLFFQSNQREQIIKNGNIEGAQTGVWTQTDWSGGINPQVINTNSNDFSDEQNIDYSTNGQFTLEQPSDWAAAYTQWGKRLPIEITNSEAEQTDYQVKVDISYDSDMQADFDDIRFAKIDGTEISYWLQDVVDSTSAKAWIKIDTLSTGTTDIFMYYANTSATSASNGDDVFILFDDFNDGVIDTDKWSETDQAGGDEIYEQNGRLNFVRPANDTWDKAVYSNTTYERADLSFDIDYEWVSNNVSGYDALMFGWHDGGLGKSYQDMPYAYYNPGSGSATSVPQNVYEDGSQRSVPTTNIWAEGGDYDVRVRLKTASGAYYEHSEDGGNTWTTAYTSTYSTESNLRVGWAFYSGTHAFDNARIRKWLTNEPTSSNGSEESRLPASGYLTSNIYDAGFNSDWQIINYTYTSSGAMTVKVRTDSSSDMSGAPDWSTCTNVSTGSTLGSSSCVTNQDRYVQYQIVLTPVANQAYNFTDIEINYSASDQIPPTINASSVTNPSEADWTNAEEVFSWTAGQDDPSGNGLLGYCVALDEYNESGGVSSSLDPEITAGKLSGLDDGVDEDYCPFIADGTSIDLSTISGLTLTSNKIYSISLKAVDVAGNIWAGSSNEYQDLSTFIYDNIAPVDPAYISLPGNFVSTKNVTFTWASTGPDAPHDDESGLVGLQYKIGISGTWFGDLHTGTQDENDVLLNDGSYTMDATYDYPELIEGTNKIYIRTIDEAGNFSSPVAEKAVLKVNTVAPSSVINLTVSPTNNTINEYAFSWSAPTSYTGSVSNIRYCYTVNTLPNADNCNYTNAGQTTLAADSYASRPGENILYVVAKDEAGNINYSTFESASFSYSGNAPGIPVNLDIADISIKSSQNWRLVLTWDKPANVGAGVSSYKIYRGETNTSCSSSIGSFDDVGTTSGSSYVDVDLEQKDYYYCVRACDSANNCSAVSSTVTEVPTGKFTSPPELIAEPAVSLVTTKRALIGWITDRVADTKIAYGTKSGEYLEEEAYKPNPEVNHNVILSNLNPDTTYYFRAKWTDEDGNTGISDEMTFKTQPPPLVKDIENTNISVSSTTIRFTTTNSTRVKIYYGLTESFGGLEEIATSTEESTYSVQINNLSDDTKYYYKIAPIDIENNEYEGPALTFNTIARPRISNITIQEVKETAEPTITVQWESNTEITSIVTYYPESNTDQAKTNADVDFVAGSHSAEVSGLNPDTRYILIIKGTDRLGNSVQSDPVIFTTATDSRPPAIENQKVESTVIEATNVNDEPTAQLIVSWDTDEPASGRVEVGEGTGESYTISVEEEGNTGNDNTNHVVTVPNLDPSKVYHLRSVSTDSAGNTAYSGDVVTLTPKATDSVFKILFGTLSNVFGFF